MSINVTHMSPLLDGEDVEVVYTAIWIPLSEIKVLLSHYDSNSGTSPSVGDCRPIVRAILDKAILTGITPS